MSAVNEFIKQNKLIKAFTSDMRYWKKSLNSRRAFSRNALRFIEDLEVEIIANIHEKGVLKDKEKLNSFLPNKINRIFASEEDQKEFEKILKHTVYDCKGPQVGYENSEADFVHV